MLQKFVFILLAASLCPNLCRAGESFKEYQLHFARVRSAFERRAPQVERYFTSRGISYPPRRLFFRVFKQESTLEVWADPDGSEHYELVKSYPICALSGLLGPKRREGDNQTPEGFYSIVAFNPKSHFDVSLQINYPNPSDEILGDKGKLGGRIFIHGNCITVGCIPVMDAAAEELYIMATDTVSQYDPLIPVHIFPTRLTDAAMAELSNEYADAPNLLTFWRNLKTGYDLFEKSHVVPWVVIDPEGRYQFMQPVSNRP